MLCAGQAGNHRSYAPFFGPQTEHFGAKMGILASKSKKMTILKKSKLFLIQFSTRIQEIPIPTSSDRRFLHYSFVTIVLAKMAHLRMNPQPVTTSSPGSLAGELYPLSL